MKAKKTVDPSIYAAIFEIAKLVPKGRVTTYGAIGKAAGASTPRIVGHAMGVIPAEEKGKVPVHRVVSSGGVLSGDNGYRKGMLESEGHVIKNDRIVGFKKVFWDPMTEL